MEDLSPKQAAPVRRPDLIHPWQTLDVARGTRDQLVNLRVALINGANYNDPAHLAFPSYERMMVSGHTAR
jgi:cyanobactin biosynthesis protein (PatB/AcyB/McaB family)